MPAEAAPSPPSELPAGSLKDVLKRAVEESPGMLVKS
jgi:hypothetical protein